MASSVFQDDKGNTSSFRVGWFLVLIIFIITWAAISVHNWKMESFQVGDALALLGIFAAKPAQKYVEMNGGKKNEAQ